MATKKFNPFKILAKTAPATILAWAVKKLDKCLRADFHENAECVNGMTERMVRDRVGKRISRKLDDGKISMAQAREIVIEKMNAASTATYNNAKARLEQAFNDFLPGKITVQTDWHRSRTWGLNPKTTVRAGAVTTGSASGCGYDKLSSSTAEAFGDNAVFDRIVATCAYLDHLESKAKGELVKTYGYYFNVSGPRFEGAVGYECHDRIIRRAGFSCASKLSGKFYDCATYFCMTNEELAAQAKQFGKAA